MGNNVTTLTRTLICDILYCQLNLLHRGYSLHSEDKSKWFKKVCETGCEVLSWYNNLGNLEKQAKRYYNRYINYNTLNLLLSLYRFLVPTKERIERCNYNLSERPGDLKYKSFDLVWASVFHKFILFLYVF